MEIIAENSNLVGIPLLLVMSAISDPKYIVDLQGFGKDFDMSSSLTGLLIVRGTRYDPMADGPSHFIGILAS